MILTAFALMIMATAPGPFDGRYALKSAPGQCVRKLDEEDGPALFAAGRYDQYEAHCEWGQLHSASSRTWTAKGFCSVEGNKTPGDFRFSRVGGRLTMETPDGNKTEFRRCPAH